MRRLFSAIFTIIVIFSCNRDDRKQLIPKKDLVPLLVDLHITDAIAVSTTIADQFGKIDSALMYSTVMEDHGYSKTQLFNTLNYYTNKPETLMEIYDEVFAVLSTRSEEAKAEYNKYSAQNIRHIWRPKKNRFSTKGDTAQYPVFDSIQIDSMGTYILNLSIKLDKDDESENPVLVAYFYNSENDIPEQRVYFDKVKLNKSKYARDLMLIREIDDKTVNHLRIESVTYANQDSGFNKSMDLYGIRLSQQKPEIREIPKR